MKLLLHRQEVLGAVTPLLCAAANKTTVSATDGILIEAKLPDICTFTTYDLEKGMRTTIHTTVLEEGSFIVNAQKFVQTLRVMDGEEVDFSIDKNLCALFSCGKSSHKMSALKGEEFPELPTLESARGFALPSKTLKDMLSKTMYAMGVNDQRPVLNGCFFEVTSGSLLLVSCDSFKMAKCLYKTEVENRNADGSALNFRFIVPVKTVNELYKVLPDEEEDEISIHMTLKHIIFHIGDFLFFSRLVDGDYIDFDRIIITQHRIHLTLDREAFLAALERAALITEERVAGSVRSHVKLQIEENLLKITAASSAGSTYDEIEVEHEGGNLVIAFNNRFLMDSVRACDGEKILFSLSSPLSSVNLSPVGGEENGHEDIFMLLPVRMKE